MSVLCQFFFSGAQGDYWKVKYFEIFVFYVELVVDFFRIIICGKYFSEILRNFVKFSSLLEILFLYYFILI